MPAQADAGALQALGHCLVAVLLVDAVLVVAMHALHAQLLTDPEQGVGSRRPVVHFTNQQRHVECVQLLG